MKDLGRQIVLVWLLLVLVAAGPGPGRAAPGSAAGGERYIVQLRDAPLATYEGGLPGLAATAPDAGEALDLATTRAGAYGRYLATRQAGVEAAVGRLAPGAAASYHYEVAFNGLVFRLTDAQARRVAALPDVMAVTPAEAVVPLLDTSLTQIGAPAAWADARVGGQADAGRGVRIAVIDSGLTATHPFFAAGDLVAPPGFPRATLTVGDAQCGYEAEDLARFTNGKVIVARAYVNPEVAGGQDCDALRAQYTPLAAGLAGFHGAHVAGIAAGAVVQGGPGASGNGSLRLSGVAPAAYLLAYKLTDAYTPEILAMIDDAVADGAQVINNSWGTSAMNVLDPARHPVAQAFAAAAQAGVVVVAAAGNAGTNGEASLGGPQQMSPDVLTVANVQTGRTFRYIVVAADLELPENLQEHPALYADTGQAFDVIEAQNFAGDLCNPLTALRARNKVALASSETQCDTSSLPISLPIPLPPQLTFVVQLIIAQQVGAKAVVLRAPDAQQAQILATLLPFAGQLLGLELPVTAIISGEAAAELAAYAPTHPAMTLRLDSTPQRVLDPAASDRAHPTSSQGPAPAFQGAPVKPDLAAPGTDILSTNTAQDGAPNGYVTATGTSMASPHVAGAAAVLRQAWPKWSAAEIRAALVTTADPVVTVGTDVAPVTVQGAGRLNLARAIDPGLLVMPSTLNLGVRAGGEVTFQLALRDVRPDAQDDATWLLSHEPGPGNSAVAPDLPATVVVPAGGAAELPVTFRLPPNLPAGDYDGRIVLTGGLNVVRVTWFLRVPGDKKDVLLVNVRRSATGGGGFPGLPGGFQDTADYSRYWTAALDEAGLSYDVWTVAESEESGTPPLHTLQRYDVVIVAAGDGNAPLDRLPGGMTALQMYLLGGGRLLASGGQWSHDLTAAQAATLQNSGAMYFLSRYFAGFERTADDVALTDSLRPERLFQLPVALADVPGESAAGNGGTVDEGRPLAALQTTAGAGQLAPDLGLAAPGVVDRTLPYIHGYLRTDAGEMVMTGVTADATLEQPSRSRDIPWRALFAGFALEAVAPQPGHHDRAQMLDAVFRWAMEPEDVLLALEGPATVPAGRAGTFVADFSAPSGTRATAWRWDVGDGRPFVTTAEPRLTVSFLSGGSRTVRVEATTENGHTWVAEKAVRVAGDRLYLPWGQRDRR